MSSVISILLVLALIGMVVFIIAENRHPTQTLAWILVIVFLPVLGLVLYFLVGHRPTTQQLMPPEERDILLRRVEDATDASIATVPEDQRKLAALVESVSGTVPLKGNAPRIYTDFYAMLDDLLSDLRQARDHIHFEFYKFEDDPVGRRVAEVLMQKAREGVAVRVQYDDLANFRRKHFYGELKQAGVRVEPFLALNLPFLSADSNFRNHRKVVVVDGRVGYIGGMNIALRYGEGLKWGPWRDTHLRLEGPAVLQLQTAFISDWRFSSKELLSAPRYFPAVQSVGDTTVQIQATSPMAPWHAAMQSQVQLLSQAREYAYLQSPYLVPTATVMLALKNAALAGVDVRVMFPWRGDGGPLVPLASRSYVAEALSAGVKICFYKGGFLHAKTLVVDDRFASIGSTNIDVRSYTLDFEIDAYMYDEAVARQMKEIFLRDLESCEVVDAESWKQRSRWQKFKESLARLLSPLL